MATAAYPGLAVPGDTWPGYTGSQKVFTPPFVDRPISDGRLSERPFHMAKYHVGMSVLKDGLGGYRTVENPSNEEIDNAAIAYIGGRPHVVSDAEAASLIAAGYEVTTL